VGACQYGASPAPGNLASDLIWLGTQFIAASDLTELLRVNPGLAGQVVQRLTNIGDLCASNPDVPAAMTQDDVLAVLIDPLVGPVLPESYVQKLADLITYTAFQAKCVCNLQPGVCESTEYALDISSNLCYRTDGLTFDWPTTGYGANTSCTRTYLPWPSECAEVDVTIWLGQPGSAGQPELATYVYDCQGQLYGQEHIMGTAQTVTIRSGTCASGGPGISFSWAWNVNPAQYPQWTVVIAPHAGTGPTPGPPPTPDSPDTGNIPTPPALDCSTATQCSIIWNLVNRINVDIGRSGGITNILTGQTPPQYVEGASYQVSGVGDQVVASGTLGVSVALTTLPPSFGSPPSEPPWYYNVGWVTAGTDQGWDSKQWLHSPTQRCFPRHGAMTSLGFNLAEGVAVTITELLPAASASSSSS
jgi:hypothetical protein